MGMIGVDEFDLNLNLSAARRHRLESIMAGGNVSSSGTAGSMGAPPGTSLITTSVGFTKRCLDLCDGTSAPAPSAPGTPHMISNGVGQDQHQGAIATPTTAEAPPPKRHCKSASARAPSASPGTLRRTTSAGSAAHLSTSATPPITHYFPRAPPGPAPTTEPMAAAAPVVIADPIVAPVVEVALAAAPSPSPPPAAPQYVHAPVHHPVPTLDHIVHRLEQEVLKVRTELVDYRTRTTAVIMKLLRQLAMAEGRERQEQLVRNNSLLGCRVRSESPHMVNDTWEDGDLFRTLQRKHVKLRQEREEIDRERKLATSRRRKLAPTDIDVIAEEDEREEILRLRTAMLKRDMLRVQAEEIDLEYKRKSHIRFSRLIEEEKHSRFGNYPVLNQRYVVLQLIGKGGFSEVFKAFDLTEHRYVACKIHQLNTSWSLDRRRTYTRHASREYEIHKQLQHPRVVQLFDVFAIDDQCFCTILEYCEGSDLDMHLKQVDVLPERSARCIMIQIFSGLRYLNSQSPRIIHFDLKPGNILFSKGEIKIADFGLSKLLDGAEDSVELTSPGYGSYWYLPPEVFRDPQDAMISSKVDVWSAGVIFFQMMFGKRPFGHELTARKILLEKTILNATDIEFPLTRPPISAEAKQFIRRCLTPRHQDRPNVFEILEDPYLKGKPPRAVQTASAALAVPSPPADPMDIHV